MEKDDRRKEGKKLDLVQVQVGEMVEKQDKVMILQDLTVQQMNVLEDNTHIIEDLMLWVSI